MKAFSGSLKASRLQRGSILRVAAFVVTLAAIGVLVTSKQSVTILGIRFTAQFHYSLAFRFLLAVDIAACVLSVLSLIFVHVSCHLGSIHIYNFLLFLNDLVVMVLLAAGCAASAAIGYVSRKGQEQSGWMPICDQVSRFCDRVMTSILLSFLGFLCFFLLAILSANGLKSGAIEAEASGNY